MKTAIREFMVEQRGVHQGACHAYTVGSVITGIVFLAHQQGDCRVDLLRELIDWASAGQQGMLHWPDTPRERQADALLLRVLEVTGTKRGYLIRYLGRRFILELNASSSMRRDSTTSCGTASLRCWLE